MLTSYGNPLNYRLSKRTNEWVRALCVVLGSETNKVTVDQSSAYKELADQWLA